MQAYTHCNYFTVHQRFTMGQTLSEPVTTKHTESCQNQFLKVGSSSMQGWRINMEDSHTHILALPDDPSAAFFGVYDGHGGNNYFKRIATTNLTFSLMSKIQLHQFLIKNTLMHIIMNLGKKVNN